MVYINKHLFAFAGGDRMPSVTMSSERKKKLSALAKMMNKQNKRVFIVVQPLLDWIDLAITDEELDYLLAMGTERYTREQAASIGRVSRERFDELFTTLRKKGFVETEYGEGVEDRYLLSPVAVGWYEAQTHYYVGRPEAKEFSRRFHEYVKFGAKFNFFPLRNLSNLYFRSVSMPNQSVGINDLPAKPEKKKTIEINQPITESNSNIYPAKTVGDLIDEFGKNNKIALARCICRHGTSVLDEPCRFNLPVESCISLGDIGKFWVEFGYARWISKEEALDVIQEVRDKGAIHSVIHRRDDAKQPQVAICNCCWDCCGIIRSYNAGATPLSFQCYYSARVADGSKCKGCKNCTKYCPTTAISVVDKKSVIDDEKCIGCGQCVYHCPRNVIELQPNKRSLFLPILKKSEVRIRG